jgi:two-component system sensor histidine kinase TctE
MDAAKPRVSQRSLRALLLRLLLLPVAAMLAIGTYAAYRVAGDPGAAAYDQSLLNTGLALGERIRMQDGRIGFDLPNVAERIARSDKYDEIYYVVRGPNGERIAGDAGLPRPPAGAAPVEGVIAHDGDYQGKPVRVVTVEVPCGGLNCSVSMAETTNKRQRLARDILASSVLPLALLAAFTLALVWFGVARGLRPLQDLSREIGARSPRDLRPLDAGKSPAEARPLVDSINHLLGEVTESNRNQQRFLANAAHQLRTPLAGLQAHAELALAQPVSESCRAELEQVLGASVRTARLANQLLALARVEAGARAESGSSRADLRQMVESAADEWVHRALDRDLDLGFELADAVVTGDAFQLREALANLVHNALEYTPAGGRVTVRTANGAARVRVEVEDDGPGIAPAERSRVLERFYRAPGTAGTGSGLGLAIVREIAAAHGAEIEIGAGEGGRGCRVALVFPAGVN